MNNETDCLLLPILFSAACQGPTAIPFRNGDSIVELCDFLEAKNIEYSTYFPLGIFQYESKNYIVTESYSDSSIIKIKAYKHISRPSMIFIS